MVSELTADVVEGKITTASGLLQWIGGEAEKSPSWAEMTTREVSEGALSVTDGLLGVATSSREIRVSGS